jgi:outer membrane protein assembly factor BamA
MKPWAGRHPAFPILPAALLLCLGAASARIKIAVEGNHAFGSRKIRETIPVDPKKFDGESLETWKQDALFNVSDLYRRSGYFDVKVDLALEPAGGPDEYRARVAVDEGDRYLFDTVRVVVVQDTAGPSPRDSARVGIDTARVDTLKEAPPEPVPQPALVVGPRELNCRVGRPYREEDVFLDRRVVLRRYGDAGFSRAKVENKVTVKAPTKTVKIDYLVEPSYPVLYGKLLIRDTRAPPEDTLQGITLNTLFRSLVPYRPGDTVRVSANDRMIEKLQYSGAFDYVRLRDSLLPGPDRLSALILNAEERVPGDLTASIFWESRYGPGFSFDAAHHNVAGTLNELRGGASVAWDRQRFYAGYGSPLTFGRLVRFDEDVDANWFQDPPVPAGEGRFGGDFRGTSSTRLTFPWKRWLRLVGDAELEGKSRLVEDGRERSLNLNFIATTAFSFLDQAANPTRGVRAAFIAGNGGPVVEDGEFALARARHDWLEAQTGYYYALIRPVKLAARLDGGRFFGEGGTNSDRFFLGGGRSVRSYGYQRLCPEKDSAGFCVTAGLQPAYFLVSGEARLSVFDVPLFDPRGPIRHLIPLEFVPFYDFGKVWDVRRGFSLHSRDDGQGRAYGLGFRYPILGIFHFRLDLAYGAPGGGNWPDAWVIDLAQAF